MIISDFSKKIKLEKPIKKFGEKIPKIKHPLEEILISKGCIDERIRNIANDICKDYSSIYAVVVLNGAKRFFYDLKKQIEKNNVSVEYEFVRLSSYKGTKSSGSVCVKKGLSHNVEDKDILIVEDIVDSGRTVNFLTDYLLKEKKARSVSICALLDKPSRREFNVKIDYVGFVIPDKFIVGYGMDYNEKFRDLGYIATIKQN